VNLKIRILEVSIKKNLIMVVMNQKKLLTMMIINYISKILDSKEPEMLNIKEDFAVAAGRLLLLITKSQFNKK